MQLFIERSFVKISCKSAFRPCQKTSPGFYAVVIPAGLPFLGLVSPLPSPEGSPPGGDFLGSHQNAAICRNLSGSVALAQTALSQSLPPVNHLPGNSLLYLLGEAVCNER